MKRDVKNIFKLVQSSWLKIISYLCDHSFEHLSYAAWHIVVSAKTLDLRIWCKDANASNFSALHPCSQFLWHFHTWWRLFDFFVREKLQFVRLWTHVDTSEKSRSFVTKTRLFDEIARWSLKSTNAQEWKWSEITIEQF